MIIFISYYNLINMKKVKLILLLIFIPFLTYAGTLIHATDSDIGSLESFYPDVESFIIKACETEYSFDYTQTFFPENKIKQYTFLYNDVLAYNLPLSNILFSFVNKYDNIYTYNVKANNIDNNKILLSIAIEQKEDKFYLVSMESI